MSQRAPHATTRHRSRGPIIPPAPPPKKLAGLALNERLVRERDRDRARELVRLLALGVAVLLPLLAHVWQQVAFVESAYRAEELRSERDQINHLLREVRMERASLESLDRVEAEARGRLGLIAPPSDAVVPVRPAKPPADATDEEGGELLRAEAATATSDEDPNTGGSL